MSSSSPPPPPDAPEKPPVVVSSIDRVKAKESFSPDEPLPAFTYPAIDEEQKQELLRRVEQARAAAPAPVPSPKAGAARFSEARRIAGGVWARASALTRTSIDAACVAIDQNRARLPTRLRARLDRVRAGTILAVFGTLSFAVIAGGTVLVMRHTEKPAEAKHDALVLPAPPKEDPVPRELEQAKKNGRHALEDLAARFPKDPRVWLEVAASSAAAGDPTAAVADVGKALAADPGASNQPLASELLASAIRKRITTDAAFQLLQGPMGAAGAAVLYDLSADANVPPQLHGGAELWVRSPAFQKVAAPDVLIAASLRYATSCTARHDLLPRAGEQGGQRVLSYLIVARARTGCGRNARKDCFPCLRKDDALDRAIAQIQKRAG